MRRAAVLLAVGTMLAPAGAGACYLELMPGGFTTSHALTIPVLVAARAAADEGMIARIGRHDQRQMARTIATLAALPRVLDGHRTDAGDGRFAVLQANTGYWTRYRVEGGVVRTEAHLAGPEQGEPVVVIADGALLGLLGGEATGAALAEAGLLRASGSPDVLDAFVVLADAFAAGPFGAALARSAPPREG